MSEAWRQVPCRNCNRHHPPPPKCLVRVVALCSRAFKRTASARHTIRVERRHLQAERRREKMCKRAEVHDVAIHTPSRMQRITEQNGRESGLLRLPLELRLQIYDYLYPQSIMVTIWEGLVNGRHVLERRDVVTFFQQLWLMRDCIPSVSHHMENALAIPLTCRQIYRETISYIYSRNQFCFMDLPLILSLPNLIPTKHLQCITSLRLKIMVDDLIASFDLSQFPFIKDTKWVDDPDLTISRRRKKYIRLWPFLATTLVNIRTLIVGFRRFEKTDAPREQQFCEWLMTPLLQSRNGMSLWSSKLEQFEVRLGGKWGSLVSTYSKPLTINGRAQIAPFELKQDTDCGFGWWGCQHSDSKTNS